MVRCLEGGIVVFRAGDLLVLLPFPTIRRPPVPRRIGVAARLHKRLILGYRDGVAADAIRLGDQLTRKLRCLVLPLRLALIAAHEERPRRNLDPVQVWQAILHAHAGAGVAELAYHDSGIGSCPHRQVGVRQTRQQPGLDDLHATGAGFVCRDPVCPGFRENSPDLLKQRTFLVRLLTQGNTFFQFSGQALAFDGIRHRPTQQAHPQMEGGQSAIGGRGTPNRINSRKQQNLWVLGPAAEAEEHLPSLTFEFAGFAPVLEKMLDDALPVGGRKIKPVAKGQAEQPPVVGGGAIPGAFDEPVEEGQRIVRIVRLARHRSLAQLVEQEEQGFAPGILSDFRHDEVGHAAKIIAFIGRLALGGEELLE